MLIFLHYGCHCLNTRKCLNNTKYTSGMCQKSIEAHEGKVWTIKCDGDVIFSGSDDKLVSIFIYHEANFQSFYKCLILSLIIYKLLPSHYN